MVCIRVYTTLTLFQFKVLVEGGYGGEGTVLTPWRVLAPMQGGHPWKLDTTDEFLDSYHKLTRKNPRLRDAIDKMMDRIQDRPANRSIPKTGRLHGLRQVHVMDHWVITWELRPEDRNTKVPARASRNLAH